MEQLNRKPLGICLILLFGLTLISGAIWMLTNYLSGIFAADWTTRELINKIPTGISAFFQLLFLTTFIFTGVNHKWFSTPLGQASAFVSASVCLFNFVCNSYFMFSPNNPFSPTTQFSINLIITMLNLFAWACFLITLKIGLTIKILGLIYKGIT
ncbi:MAG: hypothetical protein K2N16_03555, partial [Muribaculaceae bacterium]|nr:hypothetical protein [Muribaculaceae bacterium]